MSPVEVSSLWSECLRQLEAEVPEQLYNVWVRPLQAVFEERLIRLLAPNRFVVDWVKQNLLERVGAILGSLAPDHPPQVILEVGTRAVTSTVSRGPHPEPHPRTRRAHCHRCAR